MFLRALFAFLALPGIVAFAVPIYWLIATSRTELVQPLGLVPLLRVVLAEEPWLARTHGAAWDDYARRVRRWL
jgi:protein-S-isoprenylcysteine O-methyltransferase Ste14